MPIPEKMKAVFRSRGEYVILTGIILGILLPDFFGFTWSRVIKGDIPKAGLVWMFLIGGLVWILVARIWFYAVWVRGRSIGLSRPAMAAYAAVILISLGWITEPHFHTLLALSVFILIQLPFICIKAKAGAGNRSLQKARGTGFGLLSK